MDELESSELGTQEYWENRYKEEIKNFSTHGDPGEIWFGEDIVDRIIHWMNNSNLVNKQSKIVDVGCGNGMLLIELANEGYKNLYGLDYSKKAIELASSIAEKYNAIINYSVANILDGLNESYDIIHDKGTYDAISLSINPTENRNNYIDSVYTSLNENGFFIITSCNWTKDELDQQFVEKFVCSEVIPTPQFKFGGKVGSVVTCCIFKKK